MDVGHGAGVLRTDCGMHGFLWAVLSVVSAAVAWAIAIGVLAWL